MAGDRFWLLLSISASWVGVAQLARATEQQAEQVQQHSVVPLITWANSTAWIILALPYALQQWTAGSGEGPGRKLSACLHAPSTFRSPQQPGQFLLLALATNFSYIAALHFLPASLNTAVFCTSPIFTLLLSALFLPASERRPSTRQVLSVALSVLGVLLIAEPWRAAGGDPFERLAGVGLSVLAALGTAAYQVYFKRTFGDSMCPEEVGLFLAHMGAMSSLLFGSALLALMATRCYQIQLRLVSWPLVTSTAVCSALFNFLIKFGLSRETPVAVSLATQVGIPLNLFVDVAVVHAPVGPVAVAGVAAMLASFALSTVKRPMVVSPSPRTEALLRDGSAAT